MCPTGNRLEKIEELEGWLRDTGHLDDRPVLTSAERRAQTLRQISFSDQAKAADINQLIDWLETGLSQPDNTSREPAR